MIEGPPELALVAACCRTRIDARDRKRIREGAAGLQDWWRLVHLAEFHRVVPMVDHALRIAGVPSVPPGVGEHLARRTTAIAERTRRLEGAAARLTAAFADAGLPLLFFKGPVLARDGYAQPALRDYTDLDLLIREGDRARVATRLRDLGYAGEPPPQGWGPAVHEAMYNADVFRNPEENVELDVHWHVLPPIWKVPLDLPALWARSRRLEIGANVAIPALDPGDELLLLALHGTKERWNRLRMASDLAEFVAGHPGLDYERLHARARAQGCAGIVLLGLVIAEQWIGADLPAAAERIIAGRPQLGSLERLARRTIASGDERGSRLWAFSPLRLLALDRTVDRLRYLVRFVLMPRNRHLTMVRLPLRWYWAYVPVRILHDFLVVPLWHLLRHLAWRPETDRGTGKQAR